MRENAVRVIAVQLNEILGRKGGPARIGVAWSCQSKCKNGARRSADDEIELLVDGAPRPSFDLGEDECWHQSPHAPSVDG